MIGISKVWNFKNDWNLEFQKFGILKMIGIWDFKSLEF